MSLGFFEPFTIKKMSWSPMDDDLGDDEIHQCSSFWGIWEDNKPKIGEISFFKFFCEYLNYEKDSKSWNGEIVDGVFVGNTFVESISLEGEYNGQINEDGLYDGRGTLIKNQTYYDDTNELKSLGFEYVGNFSEGEFHGMGKMTYERENEVIEGEWYYGHIWNGTTKDKSGKILFKWEDGKEKNKSIFLIN